jgi:hypothetical protein
MLQVVAPRSRAAARCMEHPDRIGGRFSISGARFWFGAGRTHRLRVWSRGFDESFLNPFFHPEIFDEEVLFLFLYLSLIMDFANLINSEPFILFCNDISRNSWSLFRLNMHCLWLGEYESAWKMAHEEIAGWPETFCTPCATCLVLQEGWIWTADGFREIWQFDFHPNQPNPRRASRKRGWISECFFRKKEHTAGLLKCELTKSLWYIN